MNKQEMLRVLREANALNVKKAEDTLQNVDAKEVTNAKKADGINGLTSELPTQKAIRQEVNKDVGPIVAADKNGVSKNGGICDKGLSPDCVEAERKREDNRMKDVINVANRKVEESTEVHNELLAQLKEAIEREEVYKEKISKINALCEEALKKQEELLTQEHSKEAARIFEAVIEKGEELERKLVADSKNNKKLYESVKRTHSASVRLNKILLEAVKKAQPERKMVRYMTPAARAVSSLKK